MCEHDNSGKIGYFTYKGIERTSLRCKECNELWDYYPQYDSDDLNEI